MEGQWGTCLCNGLFFIIIAQFYISVVSKSCVAIPVGGGIAWNRQNGASDGLFLCHDTQMFSIKLKSYCIVKAIFLRNSSLRPLASTPSCNQVYCTKYTV